MAQKKINDLTLDEKKAMIEDHNKQISIRAQCELLCINRSSLYYKTTSRINNESLEMMRLLDEQHTKTPFYGVRKMRVFLREQGHAVGRDRVRTLLRHMGLEAVYPGPNTSLRRQEHKVYPYLLRGIKIQRANRVWSADITYIRLREGFVYLVAVIDWYSRYVLSWKLSNTLDTEFCLEALQEAFSIGLPEIFNSDQGCQFTSDGFTEVLQTAGIKISMDGRGRALDNIFVERLWRTVKYENIYLKDYETIPQVREGLTEYFKFYNYERYHQSLDYKTPWEAYAGIIKPTCIELSTYTQN